MITNPACPVCDSQCWQPLDEKHYDRATHCNSGSAYNKARYRVLFDIWNASPEQIKLTTIGCQKCGFVCYSPRPTAVEIDTKYERLSIDPDSKPEFTSALNSDQARSRELFQTLQKSGRLKGKRVVDFGGGNGRLLHHFLENGFQCGIIDYQDQAIPGATFLGRNISDAQAYQPNAIVCSHVLEHLTSPRETLTELAKILPTDGIIYIEVPSEIWRRYPPQMDPVTHINFFTRESLASLIAAAGLNPTFCDYRTFIRPNGHIGLAIKAIATRSKAPQQPDSVYQGLEHVTRLAHPSRLQALWRIARHPRLLLNLIRPKPSG